MLSVVAAWLFPESATGLTICALCSALAEFAASMVKSAGMTYLEGLGLLSFGERQARG
jgi:hypothetical protein